MNLYERFIAWSASKQRTDVIRAVIGIVVVAVLLFLLTGCATSGPSMTLATSHRGDGFIQIKQPIYEGENFEVFTDYLHHSEIFREYDEDTYDGIRLGVTYYFGKWKWQK